MKPVMKRTGPRPTVTMRTVTRSAIDAAEAALEVPVQADGAEGPVAMLVSVKMSSTKLPYTLRLLLTIGEGALDEQSGKDMIDAIRLALRPYAKDDATD